MNLINLLITSIFSSNIVLSRFLGICPFMGSSKSVKNAINMGLSVIFVVTLSSILSYFIYYKILIPTNTTYLKTVMFVLVIACIVQAFELILKKTNKKLYNLLGIYLPLITTNCAVLGVVLLNINNNYNLLETIIFSLGSSIGFMLVISIFATIRERLSEINVPKRFEGVPIAFITASIMALIFTRYVLKWLAIYYWFS